VYFICVFAPNCWASDTFVLDHCWTISTRSSIPNTERLASMLNVRGKSTTITPGFVLEERRRLYADFLYFSALGNTGNHLKGVSLARSELHRNLVIHIVLFFFLVLWATGLNRAASASVHSASVHGMCALWMRCAFWTCRGWLKVFIHQSCQFHFARMFFDDVLRGGRHGLLPISCSYLLY